MKVLQINAVSKIRSTGRICAELSNYLNDNGYEGYIAYSDGLPYEKGYKIGTTIDTKLHALNSRVFGIQAYFSRLSTKKLLKYIESLEPDVVHLHNLHGNYINLKMLLNYLAEKNIPTILTLHDCWFYTGKCTHYTIDGCYKWQTGCENCTKLKKDNKSWFFDRTKKMYNDKKEWLGQIPRLAVVGVSDWITNEARKSFLSSAKVLIRIYNWIDINDFKPVETHMLRLKLGLKEKFIILGVASEWNEAKGLGKFVELANKLQDDLLIILVGKISTSINLPSKLINIKETNNVKELVEYYSMADVFINFSLEESFGKVTAEALACGTPVIVTNSTANPELVRNGCGHILNKSNTESVINVISIVRKNGKEYYSKNCIDFANVNFNRNERVFDYIMLYQKISK